MPQLDMPLAKLQEYMGRTPCPTDFDEFWEKSLAEMNAIDPKPRVGVEDSSAERKKCCSAMVFRFL
jgi:cephalosporin-C deacetylase